MRLTHLALPFAICCALTPFAAAQVTVTTGLPVIGSSNPISPEPLVTRPATTPCTVQLFTNEEFADYNAKTFSYTPPASCPGPWAKIVFTADFTVTAGIQYDRTGAFFLGFANLWFGTTAEPAPGFSPSWHVEKDVTDLTTLLRAAQSGEADLGNFVGTSGGTDYNGIIYANAALVFYPLAAGQTSPVVPDAIVPVPNAAGGSVFASSFDDKVSQTFTLPQNTESVYLDVYAQSQSNDEFWWICVPNDDAAAIDTCGGTGFRETEVTIDGIPAGVAPVYPWIYTGGVDPNLWIPIPGVQTLDFKPYRVNLTPFAGKLNDGQQHTVAIGIDNAQNGFSVIATMFAYTDHSATVDTGTVNANSLKFEPVSTTNENLSEDASGALSGSVSTASARSFNIVGSLNTSHGKVVTTVAQSMNFSTKQDVSINSQQYVENVRQQTDVNTITTVQQGGSVATTTQRVSYPFTFGYNEVANPDGSLTVTSTSNQGDNILMSAPNATNTEISSGVKENVTSEDALQFDASGNFTGSSGQSTASYSSNDGAGNTYMGTLGSSNYVLTTAQNQTCDHTICTSSGGGSPSSAAGAASAPAPHPGAVEYLKQSRIPGSN